MIHKIKPLIFKNIQRISPSQFYLMKNCAYRSLLAEALDKKPLLPISPNAYLGTVLHKMLELIAKRIVINEDGFNAEFDKQIKLVEDDLQKNGFSFLVPLQKKVKNFGLKQVQLKKHLNNKAEQPLDFSHTKFYPEKRLESLDKLIVGVADLIIEAEGTVEIIDFKTGAITQDCLNDGGDAFLEVKTEYKEQLKLYAYLYFESIGKFPTRLSLVNLANQKFIVEFSEEDCKTLFNEAKALLKATNESVNTKSFSANPNEDNCNFCLYRPACSFFLKKLETDFLFNNDVWGEVSRVKKFQNGNVSVFLKNGNQEIIIKNLKSDIFDDLNHYKTKKISVYNLRKEKTDFVYSATSTTIIYEH